MEMTLSSVDYIQLLVIVILQSILQWTQFLQKKKASAINDQNIHKTVCPLAETVNKKQWHQSYLW